MHTAPEESLAGRRPWRRSVPCTQHQRDLLWTQHCYGRISMGI